MDDWVRVGRGDASSGSCCGSLLEALCPRVQAEVEASAAKLELHSVLHAFQHSPQYGVHVCESFRDPRMHRMDDYWDEVQYEAISIDELHKAVGGSQRGLTDEGRARMHQFARLLERLCRRIDRVVLHQP